MKRIGGSVLAACAVLAGVALLARADDKKGVVVDLGGLKSVAPADWKEEELPKNSLRFKQFRLPRAKDDKEDAELAIFKGLGGSAAANVERWKGQFIPPEGKKIDDVAKVTELKVGDAKVTYLDVHGTHKYTPPVQGAKEERRPGYRMLAVQFEGKNDVYQFRLTGPMKTVEQHQKAFEDWFKAFK